MSNNIIVEHNKLINAVPDTTYRAHALSVEDGEVLSKVADYFSNKLKIAGSNLTASISRIFESGTEASITRSELREYKKSIDNIKLKVKYNDVSAIMIPVTLGMKTDLYTAVNEIVYVSDVLKKDVPATINKLDVVVSKMLTSKDFRTSGRPFKDSTVEDVYKKLDTVLNKLLDPTGVNDRMSVRELLPNLSSLEEIVSNLSNLSELADKKILKNIVKQSNEVSKNIDFLYNEYKNNNTEVKKERLIELGYYLEEGARTITAYVSIVHLIGQFKDTFKHLLKALDK